MNGMGKQHLIAAAVMRREDGVLLVQAQGPDDSEPLWMLPGGAVEPGELATEALAREVSEETGLEIETPGRIIYLAQFQDSVPAGPDAGGRAAGPISTALVFEPAAWRGELYVADPDGLVTRAEFVPAPEAIARLERLPLRFMREPIAAWLSGRVQEGTAWFYRRDPDGEQRLVWRT